MLGELERQARDLIGAEVERLNTMLAQVWPHFKMLGTALEQRSPFNRSTRNPAVPFRNRSGHCLCQIFVFFLGSVHSLLLFVVFIGGNGGGCGDAI